MDRSPIDSSKRKRIPDADDSENSPIIRPKKQLKLSTEEKLAVNGSEAQREKNVDFIKRLQRGETSCKKRIWDKSLYLSETKVTPKNEETIKLLEDDKTEFYECYNESNILAG